MINIKRKMILNLTSNLQTKESNTIAKLFIVVINSFRFYVNDFLLIEVIVISETKLTSEILLLSGRELPISHGEVNGDYVYYCMEVKFSRCILEELIKQNICKRNI